MNHFNVLYNVMQMYRKETTQSGDIVIMGGNNNEH
jgi:hypothetical protein